MRAETDAEFAEYVRARQQQFLRAAYLVCGDAHLAEDLLQQALVKLALRWDKIRGEHPDAFVRRVLFRDAVSAWRRTRHEHVGLDETGYAASPPAQAGGPGGLVPGAAQAGIEDRVSDRVSDRVDLVRALMGLTVKQRAVLVLRYFEDRSEAETADLLGVSVGTVKSQTSAALARLRAIAPRLEPTLSGKEPS
jgi:RNA polymerase sigma factor (sigma-70 family)